MRRLNDDPSASKIRTRIKGIRSDSLYMAAVCERLRPVARPGQGRRQVAANHRKERLEGGDVLMEVGQVCQAGVVAQVSDVRLRGPWCRPSWKV